MYIRSIDQLLTYLDDPPADLGPFMVEHKYVFDYKGNGTPELEMEYIHRLFLKVQNQHPEFETFAWEQFYDYNDEYFIFELDSFIINEYLVLLDSDIDFYFRYTGQKISSQILFDIDEGEAPDALAFSKKHNLPTEIENWPAGMYSEFFDIFNEKFKTLHLPTLKMLVMLKMLELNFSSYYFLYTFGDGTKIKLETKGVEVTRIPENERYGVPLGEGFRMPET